MPRLVSSYVKFIDALNRRIGKLLKTGIFVIIGILLLNMISRHFFGSPPIWGREVSQFVLGTMFLLSGGYLLLNGDHVRMDALYGRLSPKTKIVLDITTFPLVIGYLFVYLLSAIGDASYAVLNDVHTVSSWAPPLAPIRIIMVIGVFLLALEAIAFLAKDVTALMERRK